MARLTPAAEQQALRGLVKLVYAEYPTGLSLHEIADTWGRWEGMTSGEIEAMRALDAWLATEGGVSVVDETPQVGDVALRQIPERGILQALPGM
jgi:hypothetical protein